jgi:hypothetical protein
VAAAAQHANNIRGRVVDAATGEALAKALVFIRELNIQTETNETGEFELSNVPAREIELYISTVGYGLVKRRITINDGVTTEVEVLLGQEALRRTDEVTVTADVFEPIEPDAVSEHSLNNTEIKNLAGVLVDDPLRAVQTLPGVATGDDFNAQFALRGSGFSNIGFYIDGVLTTSPFHTIKDINDGGSLTILNGDLVETVSLLSGGAPAKYGDRTGAVLNVQTRDGSAEKMFGRANIAASGFSYTGEGPIGKSKKLTWLASARKSYLDWLIEKLSDDPNAAIAFGYKDVQGKLSYTASDRHRFTLTSILGNSRLNREKRQPLGNNSLLTGDTRSTIVTGNWRWITPKSLSQTAVYFAEDTGINRNKNGIGLFESAAREFAMRNDSSRQITPAVRVEGGLFVRRLIERRTRREIVSTGQVDSAWKASTWQPGGYAQTTWNVGRRVSLVAGARFDAFSATDQRVTLPRASLAVDLPARMRLTAAFGQYAQFPRLEYLSGQFATPALRAERSTHYIVTLEHLLTDKLRVRVEAYDQEQRNIISPSPAEPRSAFPAITTGPIAPAPFLRNSVRGYSRGLEVYVQRRSANRLSGWISYAFGHARFRDTATGLHFDGDFDQRHTVSVYGSYRVTGTLNLSSKLRYGSNFPVVGFYRYEGDQMFLSTERNQLRLPAYSRLDVRVNKDFNFDRWKLTLYAEVMNVLRRDNVRFSDLDDYNPNTGRVFYTRDSLFPFLPIAGLTLEF